QPGRPAGHEPAGRLRRARHAGGPAADRQLLRRRPAVARRPCLPAGNRLASPFPDMSTSPPLIRGFEVVIGLETHAQLSTQSKIFSGASTAFGATPNSQASAVDIALPGVLPVLNRGAVERAIRFGLAVNGRISRR